MTTPPQLSDAQLRDCWRALESSSTVVRTRIQQQLRTETGLPAGWPDVLVLLAGAPHHRQPMHVVARQTGLTSGGFTKLADRMWFYDAQKNLHIRIKVKAGEQTIINLSW